ncbi:energy-coupling factor transporter transmembrane component T [Miniphocaeibacter massiliensis]|uniref:energy-coupling factor transporter transmembrane component T n=1 Tax=Miniphocaeibacter massiliensis TaxID=2041841 RepID=UPI003BF58A70
MRLCYAFLAAYRFVPTFGEELEKIRIAHESRGLGSSNNVFLNIIYTPRYLIPL